MGLWLLIPLFCSSAAQAASTLNFPRLSFESATLTGLAIVNPNDQSADVTLTAYNEDGSVLGVNQEPITIAANSQFADLVSSLFSGDSATVGWIQATSSTDNLTGFFLFFNDTTPFNIFDGADLPQAATTIVFTQVRIDSGYTTELSLVNPGSGAASLELQLTGSGSPVTKSLALPAMGAARLDVATFFEVSQIAEEAYVRVSSDVEVAGFELVRSPTADLVGLNAKQATQQLTHLYFPQMAVLGGFQTSIGVVNNSDQAVIVTLTAFKPDGSLYTTDDLQNNAVTEALNPGAILVRDLETLFGFSGSEIRDGWLQVESSSSAVTGFLTYQLPALGAAATVTANTAGQTRGIFSHIATIGGLFTGVAILNPGQLVANVLVVAMTKDGTVLGSTSVLLQPGQRISELLGTEPPGLVPEAAGQGNGYVFITSDLPVYLTSLFGDSTLNVLSNIPPQQSPEGFDPSAGIPKIEINPSLAIVQPNGEKPFQVEGGTGSATWRVNNISGGDEAVGTIDDQGKYTAPAQVPADSPTVTISATVDNQTAGASLDILDKQALFSSVSIVQSVVYLGSLQNLYTAELSILSGSGSSSQPAAVDPTQGSTDSEIFTVPAGLIKTSLAQFPNEEIAKMISFTASNGQEFLLLAAKTSGKVIRLDPDSGNTRDVATGLDQPDALVIDSQSGNLLVAEQTQITTVPRADLEVGLMASLRTFPGPGSVPTGTLFQIEGADGVVVDRCTGDIYISDSAAGIVRRFVVQTEELVDLFTGLQQPGQLLGLFRSGISCPDAFQMLVVESGANRLTLLTPSRRLASPWVGAFGSIDVAFLPDDTDFANTSAVLLTELVGGQQTQQSGSGGTLSFVEVASLYQRTPPNATSLPLSITSPSTLADGVKLTAYSQALSATGGTPPYSWSLVPGSLLPPGLLLRTEGVIRGTPLVPRTSTFSVRVTDNLGRQVEKTLTLTIIDPLTISSASPLPAGLYFVSYTHILNATGGTPPYTWSKISGSLPFGLSLSPAGVISGLPEDYDTFSFTVQITDDVGATATKSFSLFIDLDE